MVFSDKDFKGLIYLGWFGNFIHSFLYGHS